VRTAQQSPSTPVYKIKMFMFYKAKVAVSSEIHTQQVKAI